MKCLMCGYVNTDYEMVYFIVLLTHTQIKSNIKIILLLHSQVCDLQRMGKVLLRAILEKKRIM